MTRLKFEITGNGVTAFSELSIRHVAYTRIPQMAYAEN